MTHGDDDIPEDDPDDRAAMPEDGSREEDIPIAQNPQEMAEVLASIRALVSEETSARVGETDDEDQNDVLMLTEHMRVRPTDDPVRSGEILTEGMGMPAAKVQGAPILDEEALRGIVNSIVREELQGELGDRISRNLRKLIRREMGAALEARKDE